MTFDGFLIDLFIIFIIAILILVWFLPVICSRGNENSIKILWITIFLGWIPVIWLALLICALLGRKKELRTKSKIRR